MNRKTLLKGFALTNFIVLMTGFLLYRNGSLNKYLPIGTAANLTSPNTGTPATSIDSAQLKNDSLNHVRFSSSKSLILTDEKPKSHFSSSKSIVITDDLKIVPDTGKHKQDSLKINLTDEEKLRMFGSKSGKIFESKDIYTDSLSKTDKKQINPKQK